MLLCGFGLAGLVLFWNISGFSIGDVNFRFRPDIQVDQLKYQISGFNMLCFLKISVRLLQAMRNYD